MHKVIAEGLLSESHQVTFMTLKTVWWIAFNVMFGLMTWSSGL